MIKEFWQERREEKRRQKELKKQNKKLPKTKEQIAYRVFGVIFALFIVFGSLGYACRGGGVDPDNLYTWEKVIGITDEMSEALSAPVDQNVIFPSGRIGEEDWETACELLLQSGIDIVTDGKLDENKISDQDAKLKKNLVLTDRVLGAFVAHIMTSDTSQVLDLNIFSEGEQMFIHSIVQVDLSTVVAGSKLPFVYVSSTSRLAIHADEAASLDTQMRINNIDPKLNAKIIEVLEDKNLIALSEYTNELIVSNINFFAELLGVKVRMDETNIVYLTN